MFNRAASVAAVAMLLSGCVTVDNKPVTDSAAKGLESKTLTSTAYVTPDFSAMTAGKASFGLFGAMAMIQAGNDIVSQNQIADPAIKINNDLAAMLVDSHHMHNVESHGTPTKSDKIPDLITNFPHADYLLDVKTLNWNFAYFPTNWSHYRVFYAARLRLIDEAHGTVVAETMCKAQPSSDDNPPTKDELLSNHAALLKQLLEKAANDCTKVLASQVLKV
ncbi:hypothetical protein ISN76_19775 [Dyella halodurans]|uniref:Lipoprotein n=1 Tax=Dyella halodurans TaxID=1920171 RepID=A0ABV9C009_9GAMM|nr:hypothetical protein [Dyella halodurans]